MGHRMVRIGSALILLLIITGLSWAGTFDFNPGQEAVKHKNDVTSDVTGKGILWNMKRSIPTTSPCWSISMAAAVWILQIS